MQGTTATRFEPMPSNPLNTLVQQLRVAVERDGAGRSDGELLTRFLNQRDHDAFAALVKRHAPMVWGVCRPESAQSTRRRGCVSGDVHRSQRCCKAATVAPREDGRELPALTASLIRQRSGSVATAAKRGGMREDTQRMRTLPGTRRPVDVRDDELLSLLDQELSRLPQRSRVLIVLCDLEGKSRKDVARQLGCPEGTVASGLARASACNCWPSGWPGMDPRFPASPWRRCSRIPRRRQRCRPRW